MKQQRQRDLRRKQRKLKKHPLFPPGCPKRNDHMFVRDGVKQKEHPATVMTGPRLVNNVAKVQVKWDVRQEKQWVLLQDCLPVDVNAKRPTRHVEPVLRFDPCEKTVVSKLHLVRETTRDYKPDARCCSWNSKSELNNGTCITCTFQLHAANVEETDRLCRLPCFHLFHLDCVKKWLRVSTRCPLCNREL